VVSWLAREARPTPCRPDQRRETKDAMRNERSCQKRCCLPALAALFVLLSASFVLAEDRCVQVAESRQDDRIALVARLEGCSEATISLTAELENMTPSVALPLTIDAAGRDHFVLVVFQRKDPHAPFRYTWSYRWKIGRRLPDRPLGHLYELPYRTGPFAVLQGRLGSFSHAAGSQDEEAIDFQMPPGTKIFPARAGKVVGLRGDVTEGGRDVKYKDDYNYVVVLHQDGTFAEYCHLQPGGVLVALGDDVETSTPIGLSGHTGRSTEPHLHFAVFNTLDGRTRVTWPVRFRGPQGEPLVLTVGRRY
jgi:murein DD-endopeptidase MepM/ murein hydrolase activator NlpD